ncbi:uncharacterized protein SPAPADRAFT_57674 [Spathaspora passalidarum NRRL Y-27907]|uniref:RRM domain-containing protein n=1 Tax=Spathaspora passalidarum (strain NRRL Y-27907 / 11-Y1) TaxID=619300 RepID=G3AGV5_SPAPN|nr:uncharacterized protein SPAPADRAFT_57674 [Spathaspora passalidarum NRRL Y-27907]EGW34628.1 hypothetical protein SPAPADRAFT_57674 [Spathaspora passalidarum NRRL Y-27907]
MAKSSTKDKKVTKKVEKKKVESSSSESESSSESSSSSSSESESEDESSSDSESSSSESESESEEEKKEAKVEEKKDESSSSESESSSSDSESDSDSDSSSDEEEEEKKEEKKDESDSDSDSSSSSESESDSDSSSDEEEEEEPKKRKADEEESSEESSEEPVAKKARTDETDEPATLFVGRLSWNIDDEWLKREFEHIGGVIGARVIMERSTGKSRGYGYVDFDNKDSAEKALVEMQGKEIDGRPINLDMSTGKPHASKSNDRAKQFGDTPSAPSDTLFIGNLSFNAQRDNLFEIFGQHGTVISCRIPTHPDTQQPKGFGYVQFSSVDEAKAALEALNGEYIEGRACRLDFSAPRDNANAGGNRGGFGGNRGGRGDFGGNRGGRGGFGGNRGGRERSFSPRPTTEFKGTKKTFD